MSQAKGGKGAATGKGKKGAKAGGGGAIDEKGEDALQAVIIADSFQDRFDPFTLEKPRCLLPIANVPVIDYTLDYLSMAGVEEVFIYCGNHAQQVEDYIGQSSKWSPTSSVKLFQSIEFVKVSKATSVGDFLRDVDKRGLINGDFILVHGDLIATVPLDKALANHRARRTKDKDACMTLVLTEAGQGNRIQQKSFTPLFVTETTTGRCYHYDELNPLSDESRVTLDPFVLESEDTELRTDLIDCGIDICTSDVIALWTEHFDFELPRKHFLHNILKDWQLNGKMIYTEIVNEGYAARASNLQMYEAITKDIIDRRTFPLVPDNNLLKGYTYRPRVRGNLIENHVQFTVGTEVKKSVIGAYTSIGDGSIIKNCTIGRNCQIGKNVRLLDAFIWEGAIIGDCTTIKRSIIADNVTIGKSCYIQPDTHISYNVVLGDGTALPPSSFVSLLTPAGAKATNDPSVVGLNGKGTTFIKPEVSDPTDPARLQQSLIYSLEGLSLSSESISTLHSDMSDDSDTDCNPDESTSRIHHRPRADSDSSFDLSSGAFETDAVNGLLDALRDDDVDDFDAAKLEFMGLRLSNNASEKAVRRAVASALTTRAAELLNGGLGPTKAAEIIVMGKRGAVKFIREVGVGENNAAKGNVTEQAEFTLALQRSFIDLHGEELSIAKAGTLLSAVLQQLYSNDVLEEEGILKWWEDKRSGEGESASGLRAKCESLVEWLEEEDSSDEDDEDEDED